MAQSQNRAHAHRGPSDSARWLNCPGALNLTAGMERKSTVFAAEGTWAHQIREDCLELGLDAFDFVGHEMFVDGWVFEWKHQDAVFLQPGIDRINMFGGRRVIEYRVDLDKWMPGDFGTLDCGIILPDLIVVNDLKYGKGEPVDAFWNTQQMIYALGFWHNVARYETSAKEVLIMIDQPRAQKRRGVEIDITNLDEDDEDEEIVPQVPGEFPISLDELRAWGEDVLKPAARATEDPDAPRIPGKKTCRWCPAAKIDGKCPEYEAWHLESLGIEIENLDEAADLGTKVVPRVITPERRSVLLQNWPEIKRWFDRMHANALVDALAGDFDKVPHLKAVEGREGNRKWTDEKLAEAWLSRKTYTDPETLDQRKGKGLPADRIFTKKLIGPAGVERMLGKGSIPNSLVERGKPKPVLVPASDPKPALVDRKIEFDNLENEDND